MKRRDLIKFLFGAGVTSPFILNSNCTTKSESAQKTLPKEGRTNFEYERDIKILNEEFLTPHELKTLTHLCDIILPANENFKSATESGVVDFIDFMVKDMPHYKEPMRGGMMWLDGETRKRYDNLFIFCTQEEQLDFCNLIAFPGKTPKELLQGEVLFDSLRNLVLTGYYTSKEGIRDLGYKGNSPNVWDGVPQDVLDSHGMSYDEDWIKKCVDQSKRNIQAEWDKEGNLIT